MRIGKFDFASLVLFISILGVLGCSSEKVYAPFPTKDLSKGWSYSDSLVFSGMKREDAKENQKLKLRISVSDTFEFENIYLKANLSGVQDADNSKVFSVQLADKFGNWMGKCNGSTCTIDYELEEVISLSYQEEIEISISQWTRDSILKGISELQLVWSD